MDPSAFNKALSTLESEISRIEQHVDSLEKWLWVSSGAVVLGVAFELYVVCREYGEERNAWKKGWITSPEKPSLRLLIAEVLSIALVILGVAGELGVGILSSNANSELRGKNNARVELVLQRSTDAEMEASRATAGLVKANEHVGLLEKEAATLRLRAADLESQDVDWRRAMEPRRAMGLTALTGEMGKQQEMIRRISDFKGTQLFIQTTGDSEPNTLANDLFLVFNGADRWRVLFVSPNPTGLPRSVNVWTWGTENSPPSIADDSRQAKAWRAGEFVFEWLRDSMVYVSGHFVTGKVPRENTPFGGEIPEDAVIVQIGPQPIEDQFLMLREKRKEKARIGNK